MVLECKGRRISACSELSPRLTLRDLIAIAIHLLLPATQYTTLGGNDFSDEVEAGHRLFNLDMIMVIGSA